MATSGKRHSGTPHKKKSKSKSSRYYRYGWPAFILGIVIAYGYFTFLGGSGGLVTERTGFSVSRAVSAIQQQAEAEGARVVATTNLQQELATGGVSTGRAATVIYLRMPYAEADGLADDGKRACLYPPAIAVWQDTNGRTNVSYLASRRLMGADVVASLRDIVDVAVGGS